MLHPTDYAKNYTGIMGAGLIQNQSLVMINAYWKGDCEAF